jgi:hypothetical protein
MKWNNRVFLGSQHLGNGVCLRLKTIHEIAYLLHMHAVIEFEGHVFVNSDQVDSEFVSGREEDMKLHNHIFQDSVDNEFV